jgi:hypothetical protein
MNLKKKFETTERYKWNDCGITEAKMKEEESLILVYIHLHYINIHQHEKIYSKYL